jgi:tRNA A37 methylthiotransferase MiaB
MAMQGEFLPDGVGTERLEELLEVQRAISADLLEASIGRRVEALVDEGGETPVARTWGQADDVDGVTILEGAAGLTAGTIVEAEIVDADDYDLTGTVHRVISEAGRPGGAGSGQRRTLPVLPLGLEAVWGR